MNIKHTIPSEYLTAKRVCLDDGSIFYVSLSWDSPISERYFRADVINRSQEAQKKRELGRQFSVHCVMKAQHICFCPPSRKSRFSHSISWIVSATRRTKKENLNCVMMELKKRINFHFFSLCWHIERQERRNYSQQKRSEHSYFPLLFVSVRAWKMFFSIKSEKLGHDKEWERENHFSPSIVLLERKNICFQ